MKVKYLCIVALALCLAGCNNTPETDEQAVSSEEISDFSYYDINFSDYSHFLNSSLFAEHTISDKLKSSSTTNAQFIASAILNEITINSVIAKDGQAEVKYTVPDYAGMLESICKGNSELKTEYLNLVSMGSSDFEMNSYLISYVCRWLGENSDKLVKNEKSVSVDATDSALVSDAFMVDELSPFIEDTVASLPNLIKRINTDKEDSFFASSGAGESVLVRVTDTDDNTFNAVLEVTDVMTDDKALEALASSNLANSDLSISEDTKVVYLKYKLTSYDKKKHTVKQQFIAMDSVYRRYVSTGTGDVVFMGSGTIDPKVSDSINLEAVVTGPSSMDSVYWYDHGVAVEFDITDRPETEDSSDGLYE